jgi:hypothetical protein
MHRNRRKPCIFDLLCDSCPSGYSPHCSELVCINDQCITIPPCSTYTPTILTTSSTSTEYSTTIIACEFDSQCLYSEYCAVECKDGSGPLCASAKCVDRKCQIISPSSQISQCTDKDLSQCVVPDICTECKPGYSPPCVQVVCENGQCREIMPCTTVVKPMTTVPLTDICTSDSQCSRLKICVVKYTIGTTPVCASEKCVNGKCINIKPCSQQICKARATCPYNKRNCAECQKFMDLDVNNLFVPAVFVQ